MVDSAAGFTLEEGELPTVAETSPQSPAAHEDEVDEGPVGAWSAKPRARGNLRPCDGGGTESVETD